MRHHHRPASAQVSGRLRLTLLVTALCVAALVVVPLLARPATVQSQLPPGPLLPDLDQDLPGQLEVRAEAGGFRLGFESSIRNIGPGRLELPASRPPGSTGEMTANQTIYRGDGGTETVPNVGRVYFEPSSSHNHWHIRDFDVFELRRIDDYGLVAPDQKQGFCIGDRTYDADAFRPQSPASDAATGAFQFDCRPGARTALDWARRGSPWAGAICTPPSSRVSTSMSRACPPASTTWCTTRTPSGGSGKATTPITPLD